jgi:transposase
MRAIPVPMRQRILQLYEQGKSTHDIAEFCGFCVAAVRRVRQQFQQRGTLQPQTHLCGRKTLLSASRQAHLQKLVADQPDATLAELGQRLDRRFGTSTIDLWLRRLGLSCKKNAARRRAVAARRGGTKKPVARAAGGRAAGAAGVCG